MGSFARPNNPTDVTNTMKGTVNQASTGAHDAINKAADAARPAVDSMASGAHRTVDAMVGMASRAREGPPILECGSSAARVLAHLRSRQPHNVLSDCVGCRLFC
jgi:hypothetical protein